MTVFLDQTLCRHRLRDELAELADVDNSGLAQFIHRDPDTDIFTTDPQYVDIDFPLIIRTTGAGTPTLTTLQTVGGVNIQAHTWAVNDFLPIEGQEMIHGWQQGTDGSFHVHVITNGTDTADRFVKFKVNYTLANVGAVLAGDVITSEDLLIPADTPDRTHLIFTLGTLSQPTGLIGRHVYATLTRIASTGTAPTANPFCTMLQMHVRVDSAGSRSITQK
jgi:hypothetical protein